MKSRNVTWQEGRITRSDRIRLLGYANKVIWLTGLSGAGKSTIATELEGELFNKGIMTYVLDGDNIRHGLNGDLGFAPEDRVENIRRVGELAKLFYDAGIVVIVAFISPYHSDRSKARKLVGEDFVEVYLKCSLEECERRDTKGLYKKARRGEIKDFTGISAPYERPDNPEIVVDTEHTGVRECLRTILGTLGY